MAQKRIDTLNDLFDKAEAQGRFFVATSEGTRDAIARHSRERCGCERSGRGQGDNGEASRLPVNYDSRNVGLSTGRPAAPEAPLPVMNLAPSIYARRGYYEGLNPIARQLHFIHALSAKHPTWVFCGLSAAVLHGLDVCYADVCRGERSLVYVLGKSRCIEYNKCIVQYHQRFSRMSDRACPLGVPATGLVATAVAAACMVPFPHALAIMDSLLRCYGTSKGTVMQAIELAGKGVRGIRVAREAVRHASGLSENGGESIARGIMIEEGFRVPELQVPVFDPVGGRAYRVDYCWRLGDGTVIFGELDGAEKLASERMRGGRPLHEVVRDERLRESRLTLKGARVMRFTPDTLKDRDAFVRLLKAYGIPRDSPP